MGLLPTDLSAFLLSTCFGFCRHYFSFCRQNPTCRTLFRKNYTGFAVAKLDDYAGLLTIIKKNDDKIPR